MIVFSNWSHKCYYIFVGIMMMIISNKIYAATYYSSSLASNPNLTTNWWTNTNNTGTNPANFTTAGDIFIIQAGHTYTTAAAWNVTGTVQVQGNLTIGTANSITNLTILSGALVTGNNATTITGTFTIDNNGKYILNHTTLNGATTFAGTEVFATSSNFEYQNMAANFVSGVTYGNLIYNISGARTFPATITINGNFEMKQGTLDFSSARTIGGNFIQSGGTVLLKSSTINGNYNQTGGTATLESSTIRGNMLIDGITAVTRITLSTSSDVDVIVEGNLEVKAGTFQMNDGPQNVIGFATDLFIYGHFIVNGGIFNWPTSATSAVAGRVFANKDVRFLSGDIGGFLSTSTSTAGLYFEGPNEQTFTNAFTLLSGDLKNAFYFKSPPPLTFFINEQYIGTSGQQISVNGSFGTPRAGYDRWPPATTTNIIRTFTINNPNGLLLRDSRNIRDTLYRTIGSITRDNSDGDVEVISYASGGTLEYNGTSAITSEDMEFPNVNGPTNLNINNAGSVSLHATRSLNGTLIFSIDNGLLNTGTCNATTDNVMIILNDNAQVSGAGDNRFVNGIVRKIGNDAFEFPIGEKQGSVLKYAPARITAPSSTSDEYTACYKGANPNPTYNTDSKDLSLTNPDEYNVSTCEYWHVNSNSTAANVLLSLSWAFGRSCKFSTANELVIANWLSASTEWTNRSNNCGICPDPNPSTQRSGWVQSPIPLSATTPNIRTFTLAHPTLATATLNDALITLRATRSNNTDQLEWQLTRACIQAAVYVERSKDGSIFNNILEFPVKDLESCQTSMQYAHNGTQPAGSSFYRLKAILTNGNTIYSNTVRVNTNFKSLQVFPNPASTQVTLLGMSQKIKELSICNQLGQIIFSDKNIHTPPYHISVSEWKSGIYYMRLLFENGSAEHHKMIRQ